MSREITKYSEPESAPTVLPDARACYEKAVRRVQFSLGAIPVDGRCHLAFNYSTSVRARPVFPLCDYIDKPLVHVRQSRTANDYGVGHRAVLLD